MTNTDGYPEELERYGTVPDPVPIQNGTMLADEIVKGGAVTQHIVENNGVGPLCGAEVEDIAPVYPFRGRRDMIISGMGDRCQECVWALKSKEVIVGGGESSAWHSTTDCARAQQAKNVYRKDRELAVPNRDPCPDCVMNKDP